MPVRKLDQMEEHDVVPDALAAWCRRWLGAEPARVLFRVRHLSEVTGVRLADGRAVILKARPPAERLRACVLVQRHLWAAGFPCPEPLAGPAPLGDLAVTAEAFVPGGSRLPRAADSPRCFAQALAHLVALAPPPSSLPTLDPPPYWMQWDHDQAAPWPPDPDADLNAHLGPEWLEELARRVRRRLLQSGSLPLVVGHADWESQNLRWVERRLYVAHDWDSVICRPEAAIAGAASIMFPASGTLNEQATVGQSDAFLTAYAEARRRPLSDEERELCWAAGLWVQAFKAKKATLRADRRAVVVALAAEAAERLRRSGA
ncbi:MAG TPA: hypothetical protein VER55_04810 [Ardenticatenaceae bacterium]|nr:hypothetical protein [Ardenticatenaceae bacterium]